MPSKLELLDGITGSGSLLTARPGAERRQGVAADRRGGSSRRLAVDRSLGPIKFGEMRNGYERVLICTDKQLAVDWAKSVNAPLLDLIRERYFDPKSVVGDGKKRKFVDGVFTNCDIFV